MKRLPFLGTVYLCSIVVVVGVTFSVSAAEEWPTHWQVSGNGETGALQLTIDDSGGVTGQLFEVPVDGFISGRHLVIRRDAGQRTEVWEGWLSGAGTRSSPIVAGTISFDENGVSQVYPWYGTLEVTEAVVTPESADPAPTATAPLGPLSGTWVSLTGERMEIGQDDKRLTVTMPDGSSHSGRVTGDSSLVVGLRKGCCSGNLESPDIIVWSDGTRWERTD
jgi:hypothetical protein